jgi:transposase
MDKKRTYYGLTTVQQRKLLFKTWEVTGNVAEACRKAHVARGTFYRWKERFDQKGYAGLETPKNRAPKEPRRVSREVEEQVIEIRRKNSEWGKRRITDEMAKANNWVPLVSPNTVRRILQDADLWHEPKAAEKKRGTNLQSERRKHQDRQ